MRTQENDFYNEMIAQFMGYEVKHNKCYSPKYNDGTIAPMQFHSSWDWIIPVVSKCNEVSVSHKLYRRGAGSKVCFHLTDALLKTNIDSVYKAVVEFIKAYKL